MSQPMGWRVISQRSTEEYNGRSFEKVVQVDIMTDAGTPHTITVPLSHYNEEYVISAGNAFAEVDAKIAALGNTP